jgi:fatty-acyl-CoA synthase
MTTLTTSLWPRDESVPLSGLTVGALLAERAAQFPERLALVATGHDGERRRLTYAGLLEEAQQVAAALAELAAPGEYVALWAPNVAEWPIIQYGAALAGVVLVALNPVLREAELEYALAHSGAVVLIHAEASRDYPMAPVAASVAPRCPALRHVISLADRSRWRAEGPEAASEPEAAIGPGTATGPGPSSVPDDPDAPVMLQYTSGTTGLPKGVLLRHRSLVNNAKLTLENAGIAPGSVAVNPLPMFHTAGCVISTLGPLWIGGTMVLIGQFAPAAVLAELRAEQATVLFYVPAVLGALLEAQRASPEPAPRLRTVIGGASFVPAAMIEAAERTFGASVLNVFGQTELAPVLTGTRPDDPRREQLETVGRPLPHADCVVVDPVTGAVQPLGVPGEICAHG